METVTAIVWPTIISSIVDTLAAVTEACVDKNVIVTEISETLRSLPSTVDDAALILTIDQCRQAADSLATVKAQTVALEEKIKSSEGKFTIPESVEAKRVLSILTQTQASLAKAISLKQNSVTKMAENNFSLATQQYQRYMHYVGNGYMIYTTVDI